MRAALVGAIVALTAGLALAQDAPKVSDAALGTQPYEKFERPQACATCHVDIARQHEQAMMSQAYTHHWDEIEYFELAVPHAGEGAEGGRRQGRLQRLPRAARLPRRRRAAEAPGGEHARQRVGVVRPLPHGHRLRRRRAGQLQLDHRQPGKVKQGPRAGRRQPAPRDAREPVPALGRVLRHLPQREEPVGAVRQVDAPRVEGRARTARAGSSARTATCRRRRGAAPRWARSCPTCASTCSTAPTTPASSPASSRCASTRRRARPSRATPSSSPPSSSTPRPATRSPRGSAEERVLWLHVEATDAQGQDATTCRSTARGSRARSYTIASDTALAYQDIGDIKGIAGFAGPQARRHLRDDAPGDRIFRLPYLDPKGRMTIAQWNTAELRPRLPPGAAGGRRRDLHLEAAAGHAAGRGDGHRDASTTRASSRRWPST